jgi:hypothetical protein
LHKFLTLFVNPSFFCLSLFGCLLLLANALADYNEPHLLEATCAAGHLRRVECAWAIEQTMALTFQLQNAPAAVSDRLSHLQDKIRQDSLTVIERCESDEELDFLFPELTRIHGHDLPVLIKFMVKPDLRRTHESYISQQATATGYKALAPSNWEAIPDLTVANLYWYFKEAKA